MLLWQATRQRLSSTGKGSKSMTKVLQLIYNWGKGGFESYAATLVEKLHNKECEFYIAYSERVPMPELVDKLKIRTFCIPMRSPYDLSAARGVAKLCRELSIDTVHTHFIRERYISALSRLFGNKARLVYTSHVVFDKTRLLKFTNRIVNSIEDNVIAVCHAGREQMLEEGLDKAKIAVIHNGVDVEYLAAGIEPTIRQELGLREDSFVVTTVGRFNEVKGHKFLIESIKRLKDMQGTAAVCDVKFLLVGDGELLEECRRLADKLGVSDDIVFAGYRTDKKNIFQGSDLYVSPSKNEALSMSIIEALGSGLPVVATNVGGTSEIINNENNCGVLVEYGDTEVFAREMLRFVQDKAYYKSSSDNAFKTAREKFNLDMTVRQTYNLYKIGLTAGNR